MARESLKVLKLKQSRSTYVQLHNKVASLLHCIFVKKKQKQTNRLLYTADLQ